MPKELLKALKELSLFLGLKLDAIQSSLAEITAKDKITLAIENTAEKIDLSETNALLRQLIEKEKEDITVSLDIV